jgi:hypothetical protein
MVLLQRRIWTNLSNLILRMLQYEDNRSHVVELYKTFGRPTLPVYDFYEMQVATYLHKELHHC